MTPYKYILPEDAKIFQELKDKNPNRKFENVFYEKYRDKLFDYGLTKLNNKEKKEDISQDLVQQVIIISIEKIRDGSFVSNHEGHIFNFMKRTYTNKLGTWRRKKKKLPTSSENDIPIPDFLINEEEKIPYLEIAKKELMKLDEKCQELLIAFYYYHFSMQELETEFPFISSVRNARQYKLRCLNKLRDSANRRLNNY